MWIFSTYQDNCGYFPHYNNDTCPAAARKRSPSEPRTSATPKKHETAPGWGAVTADRSAKSEVKTLIFADWPPEGKPKKRVSRHGLALPALPRPPIRRAGRLPGRTALYSLRSACSWQPSAGLVALARPERRAARAHRSTPVVSRALWRRPAVTHWPCGQGWSSSPGSRTLAPAEVAIGVVVGHTVRYGSTPLPMLGFALRVGLRRFAVPSAGFDPCRFVRLMHGHRPGGQ
jgi:hypothetical protein